MNRVGSRKRVGLQKRVGWEKTSSKQIGSSRFRCRFWQKERQTSSAAPCVSAAISTGSAAGHGGEPGLGHDRNWSVKWNWIGCRCHGGVSWARRCRCHGGEPGHGSGLAETTSATSWLGWTRPEFGYAGRGGGWRTKMLQPVKMTQVQWEIVNPWTIGQLVKRKSHQSEKLRLMNKESLEKRQR